MSIMALKIVIWCPKIQMALHSYVFSIVSNNSLTTFNGLKM